MKVYSAERVPNSVDFNLYVTEGSSKDRLVIEEPNLPQMTEMPAQERAIRCVCYSILLNYTGDPNFSARHTNRFLHFLSDIIHKDSWFFLANRIELFIKEVENFGVEISYDF
ncbi:hypothetical protein CH373_15315 [Leptospira perolatii]|uniref:Uncharacterized protein n=1 Tax=Leptospira perolatii TaxID=2023191 RepID=A0A2M9ZJQ8_9LEPT|nr:hypothetical protein [Leptospira perolatii]PJZ69463.1 hypothetical protein CH360_10655 [Leptospira perolatii]PJZ72288.1 hypothetical protein CH373_15315 [Leptospira perolatii]